MTLESKEKGGQINNGYVPGMLDLCLFAICHVDSSM